MPSPFPGMNPYFEQSVHWLDFHTEFLSALRRLLAKHRSDRRSSSSLVYESRMSNSPPLLSS